MSEKQMRLGALEAGGTKMVCAVVSGDGEVLDRMETPTLTSAETVPQMIEWFTARDVNALGIGAFGPTCVDPNDERYGSILQTPKLAWRGYGLRAAFADALGIPVAYDTDVNVACLGEVVFGCCKGLEDAVYVTIGTGVGAGVMCAGRLLHGMLHPEAGHMLVRTRPTEEGRCVCPSHASCLEGLASGPAIAARWGKPAAELADNAEVWALEGDYLGQMCANLVLMYSPRRIVRGGGLGLQRWQLVGVEVGERLLAGQYGHFQLAVLLGVLRVHRVVHGDVGHEFGLRGLEGGDEVLHGIVVGQFGYGRDLVERAGHAESADRIGAGEVGRAEAMALPRQLLHRRCFQQVQQCAAFSRPRPSACGCSTRSASGRR